MPLIHHQQLNSSTKIGVWHITEAENFFLQTVPLPLHITHPHKKLQHLAGRFLLIHLFPQFPLDLIKIADTKKPFLKDEAFHFSISHCGDYAAAIVSTQHRVGVDIEIPNKKILGIQHKFVTTDELLVLNKTHPISLNALTMGWSSKEALFKWYGLGAVDFKKHIVIKSSETNNNETLLHCAFLKNQQTSLVVQNCTIAGNNLAWVIS